MKFDLKPGSHVHFMGICGVAMASLAGLLKDRGFKVTGSDQNVYPPMSTQLQKLGIPIMEGYKKENLNPRPDLVIVGNVISRTHEEAQALLASDIPYTSLPQAMGEIVIADRHSIVVAGTHGKTTTTSLVAWIAESLGLQPGFMIGGIPKNFDRSYQLPKGNWFVIEGDEYDTAFFDKVPKFIHYKPRSVILNSIEFDHADIYKDLDHVKDAFRKLMRLIPADGCLIANGEEATIQDVLRDCSCKNIKTIGLKVGDYQAQNLELTEKGSIFDVVYKGSKVARLKVNQMGDYNVKNALAAFALSEQLGWKKEKVVKAIETFEGVKRRQEIIGTPNNITIIEDFAHHPTAVRATIESVQKRYPQARVYSVFEPRSATSRRKVFQKEYAEAFGVAHALLLPPPYDQSKIPVDDRFSSEQLEADLRRQGVDVRMCTSVNDIVGQLKSATKPGDVILVMSNGGFEGIYEKLLQQLA